MLGALETEVEEAEEGGGWDDNLRATRLRFTVAFSGSSFLSYINSKDTERRQSARMLNASTAHEADAEKPPRSPRASILPLPEKSGSIIPRPGVRRLRASFRISRRRLTKFFKLEPNTSKPRKQQNRPHLISIELIQQIAPLNPISIIDIVSTGVQSEAVLSDSRPTVAAEN